MILGLLVMVAVLVGLTLAIAFMLDVMAPKTSWKMRAVWAALIGAFVPASLPILTLLSETGFTPEAIRPVGALVVGAFILAAVIGFPVAYVFSKKRAAGRFSADPGKDFD